MLGLPTRIRRQPRIEQMRKDWRVDGLAHAWSGGRTSGSYIDPNGPEATEIMTSFFRQHRLPYPTNGPDGRAFEDDFG